MFNNPQLLPWVLLSVMTVPSCTALETINIDRSEQAIKSVSPKRSVVTIHERVEKNEFVIENFICENDSIKGIVVPPPEGERHYFYEEDFQASSVKAYDPLSTMHIFTTLSQISPGPFGMSVDSIKLIEIHEKNEGKSSRQTVLAVLGATVVTGIVIIATLIIINPPF